MERIGIAGAGSFGIALATLLQKNGHQVTVWSHLEEEVTQLRLTRQLPGKLPGVEIPAQILFTAKLEELTCDKDVLVLAVPSTAVRETARKMRHLVRKRQLLVDVAKGIEEGTFLTLSQQIREELPDVDVAALSGPTHAEEVVRGLPTACVIGASSKETAAYLQQVFSSQVFRVYTSPDITGIELGGALKNVIALAAGMADGLGYGDNTKAALITRGMAEISRLGIQMGGRPETFSGLAGIGDLIVTCASVHSRNRKAGYLIGQGASVEEAMRQVGMVVEGVYSAKAARGLAQKHQVSMPIVEEICQVLFAGKQPEEALSALMLRKSKEEYASLLWEER